MNEPEDKCGKCKLQINFNENNIKCDGNCGNIFHQKCINMSVKDYAVVQNLKNVKWFCNGCLAHLDQMCNISLELKQFKSDVNTELSKIRELITQNFNRAGSMENKEDRKSYANVAACEAVIIKPKSKQESRKTKEMIQKTLKPAALEVGITQIKDIRDGGVVIKCKTKEEQEKIKKAAEKKLIKNYQITAPILKNPSIKVVDIEENYEHEEFIDYLRKQNANLQHDAFKMEVKVFKKMKTKYMAIVECDPITFKNLLEEKYLYINWSRCRVFEYVSVYRCFKCGGFNHHAGKCTTEEKCLKCAEKGHKTDHCNSNDVKCANCLEVKLKSNFDVNVNHSTFDVMCPVYLKQMQTEKQKIKQYFDE